MYDLVTPVLAALSSDPEERAGYMVVITFLVGLIALGLGLFRLGFVVNFISRPVLAGFASAAAIITTGSMLKVRSSHKNAVIIPGPGGSIIRMYPESDF